MVERVSALAGHYHRGVYGKTGLPKIRFTEIPGLSLHQIAAWSGSIASTMDVLADFSGCGASPPPGQVITGSQGTLLRVEPLKWWLTGSHGEITDLDRTLASTGAVVLDLSHSRTQLRVTGESARMLLNRHLPVDLRPDRFGVDTVCSTGFHHVGVTLWHSHEGFELYLPRAFALSLFELLCETAEQFGYEIT